jgi:hypothetical protein
MYKKYHRFIVELLIITGYARVFIKSQSGTLFIHLLSKKKRIKNPNPNCCEKQD